jgi:hypothetical protein
VSWKEASPYYLNSNILSNININILSNKDLLGHLSWLQSVLHHPQCLSPRLLHEGHSGEQQGSRHILNNSQQIVKKIIHNHESQDGSGTKDHGIHFPLMLLSRSSCPSIPLGVHCSELLEKICFTQALLHLSLGQTYDPRNIYKIVIALCPQTWFSLLITSWRVCKCISHSLKGVNIILSLLLNVPSY